MMRRWWPLALLALVACWLRTHDLAQRPMHADEANQAVKLGVLLETGRYTYDPRDHHGPTLYYAALPLAWIRGEHTLAELTETTLRLVPALAGTIGVLLLAALAAPLGRWPAMLAAALMAVSPPAVYYSRYFIQETLLVTFTLAAFVGALRWWRSGRVGWALMAGGFAGLMQATKATAPFFLVAAVAAVLIAGVRPPSPRRYWRDGLLAFGAALGTAMLLFSSFGTHAAGLKDALATYGHALDRASGGGGHNKPWWYYLNLFSWQRVRGLVFEQLAFSTLVLAGAAAALWRKTKAARAALVYSATILVLLSLTPYKTPWHAVHLVPGFALLAAGGLAALPNVRLAVASAAVVLMLQGLQMWRVAFVYPADERNPYAYVHSVPDVLKFRPLAAAALARSPHEPVRIVSEEYWPLPWYLRGLDRVGYWSTAPDDCDGALVIASAGQAAAVRARLHGTYRESFLGLRPGFVCVLFTPVP